MNLTPELCAFIRQTARSFKVGAPRRQYMAQTVQTLGLGQRQAQRLLGWGRDTLEKGLHERRAGIRRLEDLVARGRQRVEDKDQRLAADIRSLAEPHPSADPGLKSSRRYTNLTAAEVRDALIAKGHPEAELPAERTMRNILNRMNYRLKRIPKGEPLKKSEQTDAIFANLKAAREEARKNPETLEISMDTKAKVALGEYVRGGKDPDGLRR